MTRALYVSVFVIATCGLVYELVAGTVASYLLGDSITQFSTVIGVYLSAMGLGSYLSRFIERRLVARFIELEIAVGLAGGLSSAVLFLSFAEIAGFRLLLYFWVVLIGVLVGAEIPLVLRILEDELRFKDLISKVLSLDYLGALAASLLFPLFLVPKLGLVRTSFLFGAGNVGVALFTGRIFRAHLEGEGRRLGRAAVLALVLLCGGFAFSDEITGITEGALYSDEVIYAKTTPYQRIVLTRRQDDIRLYLNGHLQFSSFDEYRYHEALVHPGLAAVARPERALVLGGGDGLAVREILRDPRVREVTLVDLDAGMTSLFRDHDALASLNGRSLRDARVRIVSEDAFLWLGAGSDRFDFVAVDFPDPSNFSVGKLYTTAFYRLLARRLAPGGAAVVQSTSPLFARRSFWCIAETIRAAGLEATPYHAFVPSFGEWGFVLASDRPLRSEGPRYPPGLRFIDATTTPSLFVFPKDMEPVRVEVNRLDNQVLVHYYDAEWRKLSAY